MKKLVMKMWILFFLAVAGITSECFGWPTWGKSKEEEQRVQRDWEQLQRHAMFRLGGVIFSLKPQLEACSEQLLPEVTMLKETLESIYRRLDRIIAFLSKHNTNADSEFKERNAVVIKADLELLEQETQWLMISFLRAANDTFMQCAETSRSISAENNDRISEHFLNIATQLSDAYSKNMTKLPSMVAIAYDYERLMVSIWAFNKTLTANLSVLTKDNNALAPKITQLKNRIIEDSTSKAKRTTARQTKENDQETLDFYEAEKKLDDFKIGSALETCNLLFQLYFEAGFIKKKISAQQPQPSRTRWYKKTPGKQSTDMTGDDWEPSEEMRNWEALGGMVRG